MAHEIRYVCLSDLHLGEEDSLLTNLIATASEIDPTRPSPAMARLVDCLEYLIDNANQGEKPILVLCGDVLELALATTDQAAMVFERFMECIMRADKRLFKAVIYIPGNHDHHLWENARETQYVEYIKSLGPGEQYEPPYYATSMFRDKLSDRPASYFLTSLVRRQVHLAQEEHNIYVAYPNLGLVDEGGTKCAIFYHGHYIESLYQLMSIIKTLMFPNRKMPEFPWDMESENFAWIDFFWSSMGRSGEFGKDVELIYEKMQDRNEFKKVLSNLVKNLETKYDLPGWDMLTANILTKVLHAVADKVMEKERGIAVEELSKNSETGLRSYMQGPLWEQIRIECTENNKIIPSEYTLVFGHTHKPFQMDMIFKNYAQWVNVYNTGGWVVDTIEPAPLHGASIVLLDEDFNATCLRMYNQAKTTDAYAVRVEEARHYTEATNPFHQKISKLVQPAKDPWKSFSRVTANEVGIRAAYLRSRIRSK